MNDIIEKHSEKITDFYRENEEMCQLYELKDSEIYQEIVLFLNDFNREWRKNKELGSYAPEFILRIIEDFKEGYEEVNENSFKEWLMAMFEEVADRYENTKSNFQFARVMNESHSFETYYEANQVDNIKNDFDSLYAQFQRDEDEKFYLFF